jgi:hypothetical protein
LPRIGKSFTITENRNGLRGDPCGTPTLSGRSYEKWLPTLTQ